MSVLEPHLQDDGALQTMPVYSTHSTHKLLAALSQASLVHVADKNHNHDLFNESFMMQSSTSPQYLIIASNDVTSAMMDVSGLRLIDTTVNESIIFRKAVVNIAPQVEKWWFDVWQPDNLNEVLKKNWNDCGETPEKILFELKDPQFWELKPNDPWHGFPDITEGYVMLDPLKVTILTPGISREGTFETFGIPASIVSKYLRARGIVVEKTDFYSFFIIFSMAVTKGKSSTLISALLEFKDDFDSNKKLIEVFPDVAHIAKFQNMTLPQLATEMHNFFVKKDLITIQHKVYETIPPYVMVPADAYKKLVHGDVELVKLAQLLNRTSAVMVVPYPPGIPVVMPGEKFPQSVVNFLLMQQEYDNQFPGFESEIHGLVHSSEGNGIYCIKE